MNIIKSISGWLIGILFLIVFFPFSFIIWLLALPFDRERKLIHMLIAWQSTILTYLMPVWKVRIWGREKLQRGSTYVIISNHQSILDILIINCLRFGFKWVSKIENTKVPVLGWYLSMADYLVVDRDNDESKARMLEKAYTFLKNGISVMIFPEGTRSADGYPGYFKRGAFQLAIETNTPILPLVLDGTGGILPRHSFIFKQGNRIVLHVLDPVPPSSFNTGDPEELAMKFRELVTSELGNIRRKNDTQS